MLEIKYNENSYRIRYGVEATAKSGILRTIAKIESAIDTDDESFDSAMATVEMVGSIVGDMLLVGLQKYHDDEFGYDFKTKEGYEDAIGKVYEMIDDLSEEEGFDVLKLYNDMQDELLKNGFLKSLFLSEAQKVQAKTSKKK